MDNNRKRVIIIGAGFGGLWAAKNLAKSDVDVLVIDRQNFHTFFPLLYQVAAAELEPGEIVHPVRSILHGNKNADFLLDEVTEVDLAARVVRTGRHELNYDYLVIATGSKPHFFGIEGAAEHAFTLKTMEDAVRLRNHILFNFEKAARETDPDKRRRMLSFAVVGGGATGVEYAGALAELVKKPLRRDYPDLDFSEVKIALYEAEGSLMAGFSPKLQEYTRRRLISMGVDVRTGYRVTRVSADAISLSDGANLPTETVVWTAGVSGAALPAAPALPGLLRNQQVEVLPTLQIKDHPEVYAVGDLARFDQDGSALTMIATVAIQEGKAAARNIRRQLRGEASREFRYRDPGTMATIGRNAAICHIAGLDLTGFPAWVLWLGVHITNLIGFRNRVLVLVNWLWDYIFYERAVRLILPLPEKKSEREGQITAEKQSASSNDRRSRESLRGTGTQAEKRGSKDKIRTPQ